MRLAVKIYCSCSQQAASDCMHVPVMLRHVIGRCGFSGARFGLRALVDRCLVRLQDSEGETQREISKDTRLGMCAGTHLELS